MYGKHHTEEFKRMMKEKMLGENNPMYGKHHTEETKKKMFKNHADVKDQKHPFYGKHHTEEARKKMRESKRGKYVGENSYSWKGGYNSNGIPLYDTYAPQLEWCEEVRRNADDPNVLEVRCTYCDKWYIPKIWQVKNRIGSLKDSYNGENRFYCSENCKHACPIYNKKPETLIKEDAVRAGKMPWLELDREVQHELRQMVLERDGYVCQKCGSTENLHCHHILPVAVEPLLSADIDNCITLCADCHKAVHKLPGCGYNEISIC
jgi:5-methylcytosine-specific restriction endonuclease McrA